MSAAPFTRMDELGTEYFTTLGSNKSNQPSARIVSRFVSMKDYQRALRMQLCQLERQRAFLPSMVSTPPGSVLMNVLVAVLEESEKIRRRMGLLDLVPIRFRSRMFSNSISPTTPIMMEADAEFTGKADEWTLPSEEHI